MFNVTRLIDVAADDRDRILTSLRQAAATTAAHRWVVESTDPGSRNGGDILAHFRFTDETQWNRASEVAAVLCDPAIGRVNGVTYHGAPVTAGTTGSVYRTLLLRVSPGTDPDDVARFENELAAMPRHVNTILSWQLSRVTEAVGDTTWTHVFEQEFTDVDGLMGPYLMHPIHWAVVDRWFDPETTDVIIRDRVCHSFCGITAPVLS
ncbi:Dabb family protein [Mycolicibacterium goodii]|uniref:Dabb family protein n=1 Tax=Mycolicibacterium goodii TaxID=134601 RepID=UPI000C26A3C6|nr:Dabb family protein [Mycolicibacterium goodii]MBU8810225.1 Dabb family protein [Mycolicibacterium goodii]PJK19774.1 stress responsive protein [Mycolicibacterium goodii]